MIPLLAALAVFMFFWAIYYLMPHKKPELTSRESLTFTPPKLQHSYFGHKRYVKAVVAQLPDALDTMARALMVGYPLERAVDSVVSEMPNPIKGEFTLVSEQMQLGSRFREALLRFSRRVPAVEINFLISAVNIQREVGGNLSEILATLSRQLRARALLESKVRAMSAEARLSARVMIAVTASFVVGIWVLAPSFFSGLSESPVMLVLMGIAVLLLITGSLLIWRVSKVG
jgi:tight adherence protein B